MSQCSVCGYWCQRCLEREEHDHPLRRCAFCGAWYYEHDADEFLWWHDHCSLEHAMESARRRRQRRWDDLSALRAERAARGRVNCRAHTNEGRLCASAPIRGADLCQNHADASLRHARDYGRMLGELAVSDADAAPLEQASVWPAVVHANRMATIARELWKL